MPKTLLSLLYVSRAVHSLPEGDDPIEDIVAASLPRNASLGVTGALVFTGAHFAQLLEGPRDAVEALMRSIRADGRHRDVHVIDQWPAATRQFPDWSLAYAGPSLFVERHIRPLVEGGGDKGKARQLVMLMREFASDSAVGA